MLGEQQREEKQSRAYAKAQRMRGGIAEIVRKVLAIGGMPLVLAAACASAL